MSDQIKHECGLAFIRLKQPLSYYHEKYGTALYGLMKLQLLLQKQRNRGQDGAGLATIKLDIEPGHQYISRKRSNAPNYLQHLFDSVFRHFASCSEKQMNNTSWLKTNKSYTGELLLGHLRYGTHGDNSLDTVHPFIRQNNWISRNLVLAGNFNMTNVEELFGHLVKLGQYPKKQSDTVTVLEKIGHFLDEEVQHLFEWYKQPQKLNNPEITSKIIENLNVGNILKRSAKKFDGGYVMAGMIGHGDAFILRDPNGIRPAFWYEDEEVVVMASERPAIQTAFEVPIQDVKELTPGHALIIKKNGSCWEEPILEPREKTSCSFERIYFSRGSDRDIYLERKQLGKELAPKIINAIQGDFVNTVFTFIPNTAEVAFYGLIEGLNDHINQQKAEQLIKLVNPSEKQIKDIIQFQPRIEKLVVKDDKMRTFIANDKVRGSMVNYVYDVTYGLVQNHQDTLVLLDDSIVRGTTLRDSIVRIVSRLKPKKIIIVSSAPQIRYPDCYGIDMSQLGKFAAFNAMIEILHDKGKEHLLDEMYERCRMQLDLPVEMMKNELKDLYAEVTEEEISHKIAKGLQPKQLDIEVEVIFQSIEGLHKACPMHTGDWYFSGNYPTPGGMRVVNKAFVNYMQKKDVRAY